MTAEQRAEQVIHDHTNRGGGEPQDLVNRLARAIREAEDAARNECLKAFHASLDRVRDETTKALEKPSRPGKSTLLPEGL